MTNEKSSTGVNINTKGLIDMLVDQDQLDILTNLRNDLLDEAAEFYVVKDPEFSKKVSEDIQYANDGIKRIEAKRAGQIH